MPITSAISQLARVIVPAHWRLRQTGLNRRDLARVRDAFDAKFYLKNNPDVAASGMDPLLHFLTCGWREGRNPNPTFNTLFYAGQNEDIAKAGHNPFVHYVLNGQAERRAAQPYAEILAKLDYRPKVSAIVPNYNHARFLAQRIDSILGQTYTNLEVLILDDCSTDNSREIIEQYCRKNSGRVRSVLNSQNSGNVFRQWQLGMEQADGDLIWIGESDDFCEPDFLATLVAKFRDPSVTLAFGRVQFCNADGTFRAGLDSYREGAEPGIWGGPLCRPASQWFANGFGVNNLIANVGGCIWRKQRLPDAVWKEAHSFTVLGDWLLYAHIAAGGQIAYDPSAVSYFRQHGGNTSVNSFKRPEFYAEHHRLMAALRKRWNVPKTTVDKFCAKVAKQYAHFDLEKEHGRLDQYLNRAQLLAVKRDTPHILIAFLGFQLGGGEIFPINLANALHDQGHLVSMMAFDMTNTKPEIVAMLNPAIPVYESSSVETLGADAFLQHAGISLIHSHMVTLDWFFLEKCRISKKIPYLVTLHGSYEACKTSDQKLMRYLRKVSHWVYLADKNLESFRDLPLRKDIFSKLPNGMPLDPRPFPKTREQLGIPPDAVVFTLVARGIMRKGWRAAIQAFARLREAHPDTKMHLLLAGDGTEADRQAAMHGTEPNVTFLGFQSCINGLYRISDCALVPTRFEGESLPLCIIQAMQEGVPVIATRIGEIASMIKPLDNPAGILLEPERNTQRFIHSLTAAMAEMLVVENRKKFSAAAKKNAEPYNIQEVARAYGTLYSKLLAEAREEKKGGQIQHA